MYDYDRFEWSYASGTKQIHDFIIIVSIIFYATLVKFKFA